MDPHDINSLLPWLVPLLALTGIIAGLLAGLLGVGGGIVIVPVLYHVFSYLGIDVEIRMHLAVGTSLATIIPTSIRSALIHYRKGSFDIILFRSWVPGVFIGALLGTWLANLVAFTTLTTIFAIVALFVSLHMGFGRKDLQLGAAPLGGIGLASLTGSIGALSAMMGIGGGILSVPTMTLFGIPIHRAVGTAAGLGTAIAIPAVIGFMLGGRGVTGMPPLSIGYVNWLGFGLIVPATILTVPLGARLAHALNPNPLRKVFAFFLGITAIRMFTDILTLPN